MPMLWHTALADVPPGPNIIVANEFIDALPVHQAIKQADGWHERVVSVTPEGNLALSVAREPLPHFDATVPRQLREAPAGSIYEWRPNSIALEIGRRVRNEGAALIIDYGHGRQGLGDSLQAVAGHAFSDPLRAPGQADLTAHVDFTALAQSAEIIGARIHGPVSQREFLRPARHRAARSDTQSAGAGRQRRRDRPGHFPGSLPGDRGHGRIVQSPRFTDPKLGPLPGFEA